MLPCNVIVQEIAEGTSEVAAVNPLASMKAIENTELEKIASDISNTLKKVIENL
jgi:uncharacterized protein (DUF302 family)